MSKFIEANTFPFTKAQLRFFRRELEKAGSSDELMKQKEALKAETGTTVIAIYKNQHEYREKFLIGVYEPLREYYNTDVPYVFWSKLYDALMAVNPRVKQNLQ